MKISEYIQLKFQGNVSAAARDMGKKKQTVQLWVDGTIPRKGEVEAIFVWSGGAVRPDDFYSLPELSAAAGEGDQEFLGRFVSQKTIEEGRAADAPAFFSNGADRQTQPDLFRSSQKSTHAEAQS
jgi:hypothetical protein